MKSQKTFWSAALSFVNSENKKVFTIQKQNQDILEQSFNNQLVNEIDQSIPTPKAFFFFTQGQINNFNIAMLNKLCL